MSNITITDKGNYYESSCGAWSRDGINWYSEDCKCMYGEPMRLAFKQQILDGQAAEIEPEVYTGDPSEWGDGTYESYHSAVSVKDGKVIWYGKHSKMAEFGFEAVLSDGHTRISTNPADIISDKVKGVDE